MDTEKYKIIWSSETNRNLANIVNYLLIKWNEKVADNFLKEVDKKVLSILN